ncbi:hypothetical protein FOA52_003548 [Chlamydomonas sp. UWO 241]|nr:hypothetical protein FOA52_003548 [Chlamydomonas sp. UWO 241]
MDADAGTMLLTLLLGGGPPCWRRCSSASSERCSSSSCRTCAATTSPSPDADARASVADPGHDACPKSPPAPHQASAAIVAVPCRVARVVAPARDLGQVGRGLGGGGGREGDVDTCGCVRMRASICIFARDVYGRTFKDNAHKVTLCKVWSRSSGAAEEFCASHALDAHPCHGERGIADILADRDIELVVVVLPVQVALQVVTQALAAGKHVIEEKPVAGSVELACAAIAEYRGMKSSALWMIAENYRYEDAYSEACTIAKTIGTITKLDLVADMAMDEKNKYFNSAWRRDTVGCPGGMMTDMSVHYFAALRMLAHACGMGEATEAVARSCHAKPALSSPDTLVGVLSFKNSSAPAAVSISIGASHFTFSLKAVGTLGTVEVLRGGWGSSRAGYMLTWKRAADAEPSTKQLPFRGVENEFDAFLALVGRQTSGDGGSTPTNRAPVIGSDEERRASPEEGARDLAICQALLESGAAGGKVVKVHEI